MYSSATGSPPAPPDLTAGDNARGTRIPGDQVPYRKRCCGWRNRPSTALVLDRKPCSMLDDTPAICGGEFGRIPIFQGRGKYPGRDQHLRDFYLAVKGESEAR